MGSKIYYVEDGYVRGYAAVSEIRKGSMTCDVSGKNYEGIQAIMPAKSWKWIQPIAFKGFQGFRYAQLNNIKIVGNWTDPKPNIIN